PPHSSSVPLHPFPTRRSSDLSSFDLLGVDTALPVTAVMREPFFVPETKPLPELLATLQAEPCHLALVVDEYGGFVGLVTVEDLEIGRAQSELQSPDHLVCRLL